MFKDNLGKSPFRQYTKYKEIGSKPEKKNTHTHINAVIEQLMQKKNSRRRE